MSQVRTMVARYAGTCADCQRPFPVGTLIEYHYGLRKARHADETVCAQLKAEPAPAPAPKPEPVRIPGHDRLFQLFNHAKAHGQLKRPRIRLDGGDAGTLVLTEAGPHSSSPGALYVSDGGGYGSRRFYGTLLPDGVWRPYHGDFDAVVYEVLVEFASDPVGYAVRYGKRIGSCCFCGLTLTDARSVSVGYGPICADHYGLPWGDISEEAVSFEVVEPPKQAAIVSA